MPQSSEPGAGDGVSRAAGDALIRAVLRAKGTRRHSEAASERSGAESREATLGGRPKPPSGGGDTAPCTVGVVSLSCSASPCGSGAAPVRAGTQVRREGTCVCGGRQGGEPPRHAPACAAPAPGDSDRNE